MAALAALDIGGFFSKPPKELLMGGGQQNPFL